MSRSIIIVITRYSSLRHNGVLQAMRNIFWYSVDQYNREKKIVLNAYKSITAQFKNNLLLILKETSTVLLQSKFWKLLSHNFLWRVSKVLTPHVPLVLTCTHLRTFSPYVYAVILINNTKAYFKGRPNLMFNIRINGSNDPELFFTTVLKMF